MMEKESANKLAIQSFWAFAYTFIAILTTFTLKKALDGFGGAWFITAYQQAVIFIAIPILAFIGTFGIFPFTNFILCGIDPYILFKVWPAGIMFFIIRITSNMVLGMLGPIEFDIAQGLILLFAAMNSYVFLGTKQSGLAMMGIAIVTSSFLLNAGSYIGNPKKLFYIFLGSVSSYVGSMNSIVTRRLIKWVDHKPMKLLFYNSFTIIIAAIPLIFFLERHAIDQIVRNPFWIIKLLPAGLLGLMINIVVQFCMTVFSPLSYNSLGQIKNLVQSIVCMIVERKIQYAVLPVLFIKFIGSMIYVLAKGIETRESLAQKEGKDVLKDAEYLRAAVQKTVFHSTVFPKEQCDYFAAYTAMMSDIESMTYPEDYFDNKEEAKLLTSMA